MGIAIELKIASQITNLVEHILLLLAYCSSTVKTLNYSSFDMQRIIRLSLDIGQYR
jgi:hypothetical protein